MKTRAWDWCPYYWALVTHLTSHQQPYLLEMISPSYIVGWCVQRIGTSQALLKLMIPEIFRHPRDSWLVSDSVACDSFSSSTSPGTPASSPEKSAVLPPRCCVQLVTPISLWFMGDISNQCSWASIFTYFYKGGHQIVGIYSWSMWIKWISNYFCSTMV